VRHQVAIYTASSATAGLYDRAFGRAGGAEVQMTLLARALAERGGSVAHIIYPPRDPVQPTYPVTLVTRGSYAGGVPVIGALLEARVLWRALREADAEVVIVRTASPALGVVALFCRFARTVLVFSSSNVSDFDLGKMRSRMNRRLYQFGVQSAETVVVQSSDQVALARSAFPKVRRVVQIPSFAEVAPVADGSEPHGDAFLWIGRLVEEKRPMNYIRLARSLPEARFRMIVVATERTSKDLEELRLAAAEPGNVEFLDPLPRDALARVIASSVAVVNTSVLEGMPNVFLEAWSNGTPVLTLQFDPDGVVGRNGLGISAQGSWDRFVEGARELWAARNGERNAKRLREYVEQTHSPEAVAAQWEEVIGSAATSHRAR
jgi:glycosyltransferase involved in cell wall biosynthesis